MLYHLTKFDNCCGLKQQQFDSTVIVLRMTFVHILQVATLLEDSNMADIHEPTFQ